MQPSRYSCSSTVNEEAALSLGDCFATPDCIQSRRNYFGGWENDNTLTPLTIEKFNTFLQPIQYASIGWKPRSPSFVSVDSNACFVWPINADSVSALAGFRIDGGNITSTSAQGTNTRTYTITYSIAIAANTPTTEAVDWGLSITQPGVQITLARSIGVFTPSCFSGSCVVYITGDGEGFSVCIQNLSTFSVSVTSATISICPI